MRGTEQGARPTQGGRSALRIGIGEEELTGMLLIDSHCHLDLLDYAAEHRDLAEVISKARACGVKHLLSVATTLEGFVQFRPQVEAYPEISLACGVHPLNITAATAWEQLESLAADPKVVALGETGLDYYYHTVPTEQQRHGLCQHIAVARHLRKPLIIHLRQAEQDLLALLREQQAGEFGGVIHCFTGDQATAGALLDLGFYISLSGIVTFKNADALREVATFIPADRLLIETDSPYLAPVPYRGKPNQPAYLRAVADFLATLRGETTEQLAARTAKNFDQLFRPSLENC